MRSMRSGQLDRICRAIDDLAARPAAAGPSGANPGAAAGPTGANPGAAAGPTGANPGAAAGPTGANPGAAAGPTGANPGAAAGPTGAGSEAVAASAASPDGADVVVRHTGPTTADDIARLAAIWKMVADADPELAKRLPGYLTAAE
jgi:hypothetical protein